MKLVVVRNPASQRVPRNNMARKGGLPKSIIAKYGISKKAWAVYRGRRGGRRKNPTGKPLSGRSYRPRFRRSGSGFVHGPRAAVSRLPHRVSRRGGRRGARMHVHRSLRRDAQGHFLPSLFSGPTMRTNPSRRRGHRGRRSHGRRRGHRMRRNPSSRMGRRAALAIGRPFHRLTGMRLSTSLGFIPLTSRSDWTKMRQHLAGSAGVFVVGTGVVALASYSGGTILGIAAALIPAILLKWHSRGSGYAGSAWLLGGIFAVVASIISSGSLAGPAALGDTMANLQAYAQQVQAALPAGPSTAIPVLLSAPLSGLTGMSVFQARHKLAGGLRGLRGLGNWSYTYNPYQGDKPYPTWPRATSPASGWGMAGPRRFSALAPAKRLMEIPKGFNGTAPATGSWYEPRAYNQSGTLTGMGNPNVLPQGTSRWTVVTPQ